MGFHKIILTVTLVVSAFISYAQVTTSGMNGKITGPNKEALPGATIVAIHNPSGTKYGTTTDAGGYFRLPNMNVGGPYTVTVTYIGYNEAKQENIYLTLGQTFKLDASLDEKGQAIKEVEIIGRRNQLFDPNRKGAQTLVNRQQIDALPTVGRNYTDFVRMTPQAKLTKDGNGNNGITIAGSNSRYNAIFVDGAVQNDVFGLADNGANGGQIGISPFSIDIIDQFNINVSPFDVKQGGFAGGAINAVTRRGSNEIEGSAYYFFRNQSLAGKTPTDDPKVERKRLSDFASQTYGVRIGGPIIKNKLFYFFNTEIQRDNSPQPFDYQTYATGMGNRAASRDAIAQLTQKLNGLGYDPGGYESSARELNGEKFFLRLDWNINDVHKFTIRHQYTNGHSISPGRSSSSSLVFGNKGVDFTSTTNATTAELKSLFGNKAANSLLVGVNIVRDNRDPMGSRFPSVFISNEALSFGSEEFSTANVLNQDVFTLTDNFELYKGKHTITLGTSNEYYNMTNVFIRQNYGAYTFSNLNDFMTDQSATAFNRSFSAVDKVTGDNTKGAAKFKAMTLGLYAQDDYQVTDRLKVSFGIRADLPFFMDSPAENKDFNDNVLPKLVAAGNWDIKGAKTGVKPDAKILLSPRVAFNFDVKGDQTTQLRGGAGIFTSRIPFVWPGGMFNNNGVTLGGMTLRYNPANPVSPTNQPITFNPNWDQQPSIEAAPSGQIDLFAKDFKFPQVFRASLAVDQRLPWGMIGTLEGIYTKNINNLIYYNLAYIKSGQTVTNNGDDHRPLWQNVGSAVRGNYTDIMYAENTSKGYTYNVTAQLQKNFNNGLSANVAYTYGAAKGMNDGQSSQNSSQWRVPNVNGRNAIDMGYSVFDMGSRIVASVTYKKSYAKHFSTGITLFYTGQSGERFSYGYRDVPSQNVVKDYTGSSSDKGLNLIYVPRSASEINLVDYTDNAGVLHTKDEQWAALNSFIDNDKYLSTRRGQYAERNGTRTPFTNIFDLHLEQEFYISQKNGKTHTLQLTFDVFNLGNMLNKDWGRLYTTRTGMNYNNFGLIDFTGFAADGTTPQYRFTSPHLNDNKTVASIDDAGLQTARWQSQVGIRYIFR